MARRDRHGFKQTTETTVEHTSGWTLRLVDGHWRVTDSGDVVRGDFDSLNEAKGVALFYIEKGTPRVVVPDTEEGCCPSCGHPLTDDGACTSPAPNC